MRVTKSLRYLCLIFVLFIDILIYTNVLKNILSSMKPHTKLQKITLQRKPTPNIKSQIISFHDRNFN